MYRPLTSEEISDRQAEYVRLSLEIDKLETDRKATNGGYRDTIKELGETRYRIGREISTGQVEESDQMVLGGAQ